MDDEKLDAIEFEIRIGQTLPGRDAYALRTMAELVAEVRRCRAAEREALRILGAIIDQHVPKRIDLPEEALRRDYTVGRIDDPATLTVRFRAEVVDHET